MCIRDRDAHSRTKDEYERLEKILEELNERMEALREESRDLSLIHIWRFPGDRWADTDSCVWLCSVERPVRSI